VLKGPFRSAGACAAEARLLVFDVCMSVVRDRTAALPSLPVWGASEAAESEHSYQSTLPQPYITQVGGCGVVDVGVARHGALR
jgi:hypothetical protein